MDIGLGMNSHGIIQREDEDVFVRTTPSEEMRVIEVARRAEELGFHSVWFPDHIVMDRAQEAVHLAANASGRKAYADGCVLLCPLIAMAMAAAATSTIEVATSVLIAPYRHPLSVAHQVATIDALSGGRTILGIGPGWLENEFTALGLSFADRGRQTEECLEVYKLAWTEPWLEFHGEFYEFENVSMEPKPARKPHPPLVYGGLTARGARRAVRHCDGFYPTFLDTYAEPDRYAFTREAMLDEAEQIGRDLSDFKLYAFGTAQLNDTRPAGEQRPTLSGRAEEIVGDLEALAANGYAHTTLHFDVGSGTTAGLLAQIEQFAEEVLPAAREIEAVPLA